MQAYDRFQSVAVIDSPRGNGIKSIDPCALCHDTFLKKVPPGSIGTVSPVSQNAAFRLAVNRSGPPIIGIELTLRNHGAVDVPLDLRKLITPDNKVVIIGPAEIDLADESNLELPKADGPTTLDLSIGAILNTAVLSSDPRSVEYRACAGVLRMALARLRTEHDTGVLRQKLSEAEHRDQIGQMGIRSVMNELLTHPDGYRAVREFAELFLRAPAVQEKTKLMKETLVTIVRDGGAGNPIVKGWIDLVAPKPQKQGAAAGHRVIQTVSGRPGALSFTAVRSLLQVAASPLDVTRAVKAMQAFSVEQAVSAGQNPAERRALGDVLVILRSLAEQGVKATVAAGKINLRAAVALNDDSTLRRDLIDKVEASKKRADTEAKRLGDLSGEGATG